MTLPNWLRSRIIALVHDTLDEKLAVLTDRTEEVFQRIGALERLEKLTSQRIEEINEQVVSLRALGPEVTELKREVRALSEITVSATENIEDVRKAKDEIARMTREAFASTDKSIRDEASTRSGAINTLKYEFQKDIDRLDSLFRNPPKSASTGRVRLNKRTS